MRQPGMLTWNTFKSTEWRSQIAYALAAVWQIYLERLHQLNWQLEDSRQILEANFATARNRALHNWTEMESQAWDADQRARAPMLQQPPAGNRTIRPPELDAANLLAMQLNAGGRVAQNRPLRGFVDVNPLAIRGNVGDTFTVTLKNVPNGSCITTVEIVGGPRINWQPNGPLTGTVTLQGNVGPVIPRDPDTGLPRPHVRIHVLYIQPDGTRRLAVGSIGIAR